MVRALLIIDVQNDFTEGGALGVEGGAAVAASITEFLAANRTSYDLVIASRDWHSGDTDNGGHFATTAEPDFIDTWPVHCVAGTPGADYHPALDTEGVDVHIKKGQGKPAYSLFEGIAADGRTAAELLDADAVNEIDVVGIATDYCVRASALDARATLGSDGAARRVRVFSDLIAGVAAASSAAALTELAAAGIEIVPSSTLTSSSDNSPTINVDSEVIR